VYRIKIEKEAKVQQRTVESQIDYDVGKLSRYSDGLRPDGRCSIPSRGRDFSLLRNVQNGSGAHPASHPIGKAEKRPRCEANHSPPSSAEVKNDGAVYLHSSTRLNGIVLK
jgi:hypothetical protein